MRLPLSPSILGFTISGFALHHLSNTSSLLSTRHWNHATILILPKDPLSRSGSSDDFIMTSTTSTPASASPHTPPLNPSSQPPTFTERLQCLAVPFVCLLIAFLSYSSQIVFHWLEPGPLSKTETIWINILILCIWTSYHKAVTTDPGRLPKKLRESGRRDLEREKKGQPNWCRKCDAIKPPRSHHCKICQRYLSHLLPSFYLSTPTTPSLSSHCPTIRRLVLTKMEQMYTKNGPPLPLDLKLHIRTHTTSLSPFPLFHRPRHVILRYGLIHPRPILLDQ